VREHSDDRWILDIAGRPSVVADFVVGADGIGSKVREQLTMVRPQYTGITMISATMRKEVWRGSSIDQTLGEGSVMFAGGNKTIFVQRCANDLILLYYSLAVSAGWPKSESFDLNDKAAVLDKVKLDYADWSSDLIAMLTDVDGKFHVWPNSFMPPDYRWTTQPGITMLGDASHAMPPYTGKGVNLALLDALELAEGLGTEAVVELTTVIEEFEERMQERTKREIGACLEIGRQAYGIEMDFSEKGNFRFMSEK
jgi:2-polyprenyl-6-methoxyphenol hydroxylase-like FAD-dependent oxidoreductase